MRDHDARQHIGQSKPAAARLGYDGRMEDLLRAARVPLLDDVPGLVHGFERRLGGGRETHEAARARVERALDGRARLLLLKQVHGCRLVHAPWDGRPEADAAVSTERGLVLGIETADCLPVLVVDARRRAVAAAHAGWRGTAAGVARTAVRALVEAGSEPADLLAALGPNIGVCCYEVGDDVREAFGAGGDPFFRPGPRGRPHLDVRAANRAQLLEEGLREENIATVAHCTFCAADAYHSYRRDGKAAGRMINFVGFEM
jgi:purine-nucleoside/S-methyl-5'-thioadenosine phosphorylase / adenosine deaminase